MAITLADVIRSILDHRRQQTGEPPMFPTCPCQLAVPLDYSQKDRDQARHALALIDQLGEWTTLTILGGPTYRVSRHCIALHGIEAARLADYGLEEIPPPR